MYVLFLLCGKPTLKFLSIKPSNNANAEGIHNCIKKAFEQVRVLDISKKFIALNVDGSAVNTGVHHGVGALTLSLRGQILAVPGSKVLKNPYFRLS